MNEPILIVFYWQK